ncbi:TetR/AcrR family transcriptional regulator [Eubacterium sp. MSJ-13]|uniref:TetR/AcrR family transcriptional regulator n=1 Tax=Eubacterium sp. MSJ-13 TaxID=2841513 RepID=UPI001C104C95|nr:TetR/AcrR family transcriptional regulator [Eubacterium sp. MSJ-13]MBU5479035.1 TetR/AcrR family transcriptional regulator [Eubacterium sp. MSJ-13]
MSKIEEKKKNKQDALLASAFKLFTEKGINNTSISEIVKNAKMAKGTFYLYFKDKYDIRDRLITHKADKIFENAYADLEKCECKTLEECILFIVDNIVDQLSCNQSLLKFISKNLSWAIFSNLRIGQLDNKSCMDIFDDIIESSGRKFRDVNMMVFMIVELVNSTCYNVILYSSPVSLEQLKPDLHNCICDIVSRFEICSEPKVV